MQMKNINTRADFLRKEIQLNRQEAIEENHQLIKNFNTKLTHDVTNLNEQLEEVRGEIAESIKQRKRERADLMTEMQHITKRIDRGKEEYDSLNQMLQILHRETNCLIKALKIQQALDMQDEIDRESIFLMGIKESNASIMLGNSNVE